MQWHAVPLMRCGWCRGKESVDGGELELLGEMLWFADQAYEGESERTLHARLMKKGRSGLLDAFVQHCLMLVACYKVRPLHLRALLTGR